MFCSFRAEDEITGADTIGLVNYQYAVVVLFLFSPLDLGGLAMGPVGIGQFGSKHLTANPNVA
jgi:hypothetical protein